MKIQCKVCNKIIENYTKNQMFLKFHVLKEHNLTPQQYYDDYFKKDNEGICHHPNCTNDTKFVKFSVGYRDYCGAKCANLDPKTTEKKNNSYFEKTGYIHNMHNPDSLAKLKKTNNDKYGTDHYISSKDAKKKIKNYIDNRSEEDVQNLLEKRKETNLDRYGVECVFSNNVVIEKIQSTHLQKYGNKHISKANVIRDKIKNNYKNKTKEEKLQISNKSKSKIRKHNILQLEKTLPIGYKLITYNNSKDGDIELLCPKGHIFSIQLQLIRIRLINNKELCTTCNPLYSYDKSQSIVLDYIKSILPNEQILYNTRKIITPLELDIYIPRLNLAIEYCGLYWHSELYHNSTYHLNKTKLCEDKGIHLIHIYEDDWLHKENIVKSRLKNILGSSKRIFARKCEIKEVPSNETKTFLINNHIQGNVNSKYRYGLYYNNELVSIMTFGGLRKNLGSVSSENEYELLRFSNKLNTTVIGGASKLFKHFTKNNTIESIISYADRSWTMDNDNTLYNKLGFTKISETKSNYYYINKKDCIRENRYKYRKSELVKSGYDENLTEKEIMFNREIYRLYDSGSLKYIWTK